MNKTFDTSASHADFPILSRLIHGDKHLIYLDNAATSQKPRQVIDAISNYYLNHNANVHRGIHQLGDESTKIFHQARETIAQFFGAQPTELVTVRNTTEAVNLVAQTWGTANISSKDVILLTEMEHHSNLVPWQELAHREGAQLAYIAVTPDGQLDLKDADEKVRTLPVKLLALSHVSNALGTRNDIELLGQLLKKYRPDAKLFVDGAQAAPHLPINFHQLDVDFYAVSAHKMLGPMGIGGLFVREKLLETLTPFLFGGGMINEVKLQETSFAEELDERFTAGTPDGAGLVGWAAACEYLQQFGMAELLEHDQELVKYTVEQLSAVPQVKLIGITDPTQLEKRVGSVAFLYEGVHAHDVGQILDSEGVAVRSGHHCTMPLHRKFEWAATVRVSFQLYNTTHDIDACVEALKKVQKVFGI